VAPVLEQSGHAIRGIPDEIDVDNVMGARLIGMPAVLDRADVVG
jgi:hypothetical protein